MSLLPHAVPVSTVQQATGVSTSSLYLGTSQAPSPNRLAASLCPDEAPGAAGPLLPGAQGAGAGPVLQGELVVPGTGCFLLTAGGGWIGVGRGH